MLTKDQIAAVKTGDRIQLNDNARPWARRKWFTVTEVKAWGGVLCEWEESPGLVAPYRCLWNEIECVSHRTADNPCPRCGSPNDSAEVMSDLIPDSKGKRGVQPGDLSMCIHCGLIAVFDEHLKLRGLSEAEMEHLRRDEETLKQVAAFQSAVDHFARQRHKDN